MCPQPLETLLDTTETLFERCRVSLNGGVAYLSTPEDGHFPRIVTREQALLIVGLTELGDVDGARRILRSLLALQLGNGRWDVGYRPDGTAYQAPGVLESTAISVWAMLKYAADTDDQTFPAAVEARVRRALDGLIALLHPQTGLPLVDADLLPPAMSAGYSVWTACVAGAALNLAAEVYRERDFDETYGALRHGIESHLLSGGRFVVRLTRDGRPDLRPAITMLAPALFELWDVDDAPVAETLRCVRSVLIDRRIGGYVPFLAFAPGEMGALPSVSPLATAWVARLLHLRGDREDADKLLRWQLGSMVQGALPRAIVTHEGLATVLRQKDSFVRRAAEVWPGENVQAVLDDLAGQREERSLLYAGSPHLLTHLETVRAFRAGGYVDAFTVSA